MNEKNNINVENDNKEVKVKTKKRKSLFSSISVIISVGLFIIAIILISQLLLDNGVISSDKFYDNTSINGFDVSGMTKDDVVQMISSKFLKDREDLEIKLKYQDKEWTLTGSDFPINNNIEPYIDEIYNIGRKGSISEKVSTVRNIKTNGLIQNVSYTSSLVGFDDKINEIIAEINIDPVSPSINFNPNSDKEMFTLIEGKNGLMVDKELLYKKIDNAFNFSKKIEVEIPTCDVLFEDNGAELLKNTKLRSSFSTDYSSSTDDRKNNVKVALSNFNGKIIQPGEEISFNETIGETTEENGYKKAKIILNGVYVDGYGGGVCQASTTLYNALILSDLEILEVNPHSLPVSYVPLAFDAMVSDGYSDLKFKNNLDYPIYIKTWGDNKKVYVEIYGQPLDEGMEIKRRAEFVSTIPHEGDQIVKDVNGEYSDKITYKGEYLRIKYPREGYHSKAYLSYYINEELIAEKLIRDEIYKPQKGLVIEGTETLGEGMILPDNDVEIIPPQNSSSDINEKQLSNKINIENPSKFNP